MECENVHPLIEPFCDDELDVASAAGLVAHLEACDRCVRAVREAEERRASLRLHRPVDSCPEELKARLLSTLRRTGGPAPAARPARRTTFLVAATVAAAGFAATFAFRLQREAPPHRPEALAAGGVVRELTGEVFCLRCALGELFPGVTLVDAKHLPVLRTDDGQIVTILDNELAERRLALRGCAGRRVTITARYLPDQGLAEVLEVFPAPAATVATAHGP